MNAFHSIIQKCFSLRYREPTNSIHTKFRIKMLKTETHKPVKQKVILTYQVSTPTSSHLLKLEHRFNQFYDYKTIVIQGE